MEPLSFLEGIKRLININGGWFIMGSGTKPSIGEVRTYDIEGVNVRLTVIAHATDEEAAEECHKLGLPVIRSSQYYFKCVTD